MRKIKDPTRLNNRWAVSDFYSVRLFSDDERVVLGKFPEAKRVIPGKRCSGFSVFVHVKVKLKTFE